MAPNLYSKSFKALHILAEPTCPASSPAGPFSTILLAPHYPIYFVPTMVTEQWLVPGTGGIKMNNNWPPTLKDFTVAASLDITGTVPNTLHKLVISSSLQFKEVGIIMILHFKDEETEVQRG